MATTKSRLYVPSTSGLTNELYFASHKPDGDNEKTPPVSMRNKYRSAHVPNIPIDNASNRLNNRRPVSSPVRSTTYVLQHHRINSNNNNNITNNKKFSSPVHQHHQPSSTSPMTLNKSRQTQQQQRINSNHERLPIQPASTVDSTTVNQQVTTRAHTILTPRRTSPIVKSTPVKTTTTATNTCNSRSPRVRTTSETVIIEKENKSITILFMNINYIIFCFLYYLDSK